MYSNKIVFLISTSVVLIYCSVICRFSRSLEQHVSFLMWRETVKNPRSFWRGWSCCVGFLSTKASMMLLLMLLETVLGPCYLIEVPNHWPLGFRLVGEEFSNPLLSSHTCIGQRRFAFTRGSQNERPNWFVDKSVDVTVQCQCILHLHYTFSLRLAW